MHPKHHQEIHKPQCTNKVIANSISATSTKFKKKNAAPVCIFINLEKCQSRSTEFEIVYNVIRDYAIISNLATAASV